MDFHVEFLGSPAQTYKNDASVFRDGINRSTKNVEIGGLFDMVEFFLQHSICSKELYTDLAKAFVKARAAYRVVDGQIIGIGTEEQAAAFQRAIAHADSTGALPTRTHLVAAGVALRNFDWAGSVRESIHAVEAMAKRLAPDASTLGPALAALERKGRLHGGLKAAFTALYGYSSDEEGVRHALVFNKEAQVDEADALFMLGACASFVSYVLTRESQARQP